ncbi:hypothetical protein MY8738_009897 [Beauveria namnaoensis]
MPIGLLSLSTELLTIIIAFVAETSPLRCLRLTCSRLAASAAPELFRSFVVRPRGLSVARFHALLDVASPYRPRTLVRRVVFEFNERRQGNYLEGWEPLFATLLGEWRAAVARLAELENVQHVCVRFRPNCLGVDFTGSGWRRDFPDGGIIGLRRNILIAVFEAIASMRQPLRSLSIENLLNFVDTALTDKPCFTEVITSIQELHISIAAEIDEDDPLNPTTLPPLPRFWPLFASVWLAPAAPRLSSLTIYSNIHFGAVPYWQDCFSSAASPDTVALAFPRLHSLALGRYTLAYEAQIDDFLVNATVLPELRRLTLDDCSIMSHLCVYEPGERSPVHRKELRMIKIMSLGGEPRHIMASRLRWDTVFDRLREGLPSLKMFVFTRGPWQDDAAFSERDSNISQFLARRYLTYHEGVSPSQFIEPLPERYDDPADGYVKHYNEAFFYYDDRDALQRRDPTYDEVLVSPSNDLKVYRAELEAFNRLNEALLQRRQLS